MKTVYFFLTLLLIVGCSSSQPAADHGGENISSTQASDFSENPDDIQQSDDPGLRKTPPPEAPPTQVKPLFERLGGKAVTDQIANTFVDLMAKSPELNKNSLVAAAMKGDLSRQKSKMALLFCQVTEGPCKYDGKNIHQVHAPFKISPEQWRVMGRLFIQALKQSQVGKTERVEFSSLLVAKFKYEVIED